MVFELDNSDKSTLRFRKAWVWPDSVQRFFKKNVKSPSLHVFSGSSMLGDTRVDIVKPPKTNATVIANTLDNLPFRDDCFQTVFGDPPWHIAKHLRSRIMYELRRVCKPHGEIILNAN